MYKAILRKFISAKMQELLKIILDRYSTDSYSQEGEDMILLRLFEQKKFGFYVDVGAHHPVRFSNTYLFYKKGWSGINIDAMPGSMWLFNKCRRRDINLEIPVSLDSKNMTYYIFNEPALNGFDPILSNVRNEGRNSCHVIDVINLRTKRLDEILSEYLPKEQHIDFLSIDVEGLDFEVLKSNDWDKYKPDVVLVEVLGKSLAEILEHETTTLLRNHGYSIYSKAVNTVIFKQSILK